MNDEAAAAFDTAVIGGGVNGRGIVRDAAGLGARDFGSGLTGAEVDT